MKRFCIFLFFLLSSIRSESDFLLPLAEEFSRIAEKIEGRPMSLPLVTKELRKNLLLEDEAIGNPKVESSSGMVTGATYPESHAFYSVPYGQAPIKNLRFKPPEAVVDQREINASVPNYINCFEFDRDCSEETCDQNYSEDCLVINIHVPSTIDLSAQPSEKLPVMFWLHGGAFFFGGGTKSYYDSRWLSNVTDTVVVTVNYRLGPFGFLVYDDGKTSFQGNQGIKDQQLALKWVYDNIGNFGGDRNQVTIFGQSAGAQSVTYHLMSAKSNQFFKRAIIQSNPAAYFYPTKKEAEKKAEALLKAIDCDDKGIECLLNTSAWDLIGAHLRVAISEPNFFDIIEPYRPVMDEEFPEAPMDFFRAGKWDKNKEIIIGVTSEEVAYLSVILKDFKVGKQLFGVLITFLVGDELAPLVIEKYEEVAGNPGPGFDYTDILAQAVADMLFVCPSKTLGRFMSLTSTAMLSHPAVYFYIYDHRMEASNCDKVSSFCGYAYHAADIPFVFANGLMQGLNFTENDLAVEKQMNNFWGHFAHNGIPTTNLSSWPYYSRNTEASEKDGIEEWSDIRIVAPNGFVESDYNKDLCAFWDETGIYVDLSEPTTTTVSSESTSSQEEQPDPTTVAAEMTTSDAVRFLSQLFLLVSFLLLNIFFVNYFEN